MMLLLFVIEKFSKVVTFDFGLKFLELLMNEYAFSVSFLLLLCSIVAVERLVCRFGTEVAWSKGRFVSRIWRWF